MAIALDGHLFVVTRYSHITPGNWRGMVNLKVRNVATGAVLEKRFRSDESVDRAELDRREIEYLYSDATGHVFMDLETYDQFTLPEDLLDDAMLYVKANTSITGLFSEGRPVAIELPKTVDLEVTETTPVVKGATATNQLKEATLETGLKTRVPPFIQMGEVIRLSTEDGSYLARA